MEMASENIIALADLSEDEDSPRHNVNDQQLFEEISQCNADSNEAFERRQIQNFGWKSIMEMKMVLLMKKCVK